jgi:hypothetical protein
MNAFEALRAIIQRYARAADERDIAALVELFHPEAVIFGARGEQSLDQWLDTMRAPRSFPQSMHVLGDPLIELGETAEDATLDTYAVVYQLNEPASGKDDLTLGIRYIDRAVLLDGVWVISRRETHTMWIR